MWDDLQILLNQIYTVNGQNNNLTFLNIPRMTDLNKYFRDGRAHYWVQVIERGVACIFIKDDFQCTGDVWHFKDAERIFKKYAPNNLWNFLPLVKKIWINSKIPNYVTTVYYDDIPEPDRTDYKNEKRKQEFEGMNLENRFAHSTAKAQRDKLIVDILKNGVSKVTGKKYTQIHIANILGVNHSRVSRWLKLRRRIEQSVKVV
jgi:hypothetical protein